MVSRTGPLDRHVTAPIAAPDGRWRRHVTAQISAPDARRRNIPPPAMVRISGHLHSKLDAKLIQRRADTQPAGQRAELTLSMHLPRSVR